MVMSRILDFKSSSEESQIPVVKMAKLLLLQAINADADFVVFELDLEAHRKIKAEREDMAKINLQNKERFPTAFQITLKSGEKEKKLAPATDYLFEPVTRVFLNAAEIPYWTKGETSAELETCNSSSSWGIESKDLTQRIQLRRIRAT
jgi:hypothetical protein